MLKENDIILLEAGMHVFAQVPEKFRNSERPKSDLKERITVVVGREYPNYTEVSHIRNTVSGQIKKVFRENLQFVEDDILKRFVNFTIPEIPEEFFLIPPGEYLVTMIIDSTDGARWIHAQQFFDDQGQSVMEIDFFQGSRDQANLNIARLRPLFK